MLLNAYSIYSKVDSKVVRVPGHVQCGKQGYESTWHVQCV